MIYLRSLPAVLHDWSLQLPRFGALQPVYQPPAERAGSPVRSAIAFLARGVGAFQRYCRQRRGMRFAQRHLLELDDRLLRDIGLSRDDVRGGRFTIKGEL
jgi:uncharacterized protein YjiS (DUF1127 family)